MPSPGRPTRRPVPVEPTTRSPDLESTTKEHLMAKSPQRRDSKKVGKTLKEKREAKRAKSAPKPLER
ncbi:hypothetical protein YM304_18160 [Ilumatobacter coccineus YM16-304]|uniref:Uncharacterized protein n=1 Tax=Ilumatobacter coccineus (strain NBRC 103263 / KCTC 29153 / YM16-304) TaxID=1313172 RepID=A0A6C7E6N9_ILUCY|nr:hypothetical protein YM304_18160 [Ilumatobacter coccineus YM16-304]